MEHTAEWEQKYQHNKRPPEVARFLRQFSTDDRHGVTNQLLAMGLRAYPEWSPAMRTELDKMLVGGGGSGSGGGAPHHPHQSASIPLQPSSSNNNTTMNEHLQYNNGGVRVQSNASFDAYTRQGVVRTPRTRSEERLSTTTRSEQNFNKTRPTTAAPAAARPSRPSSAMRRPTASSTQRAAQQQQHHQQRTASAAARPAAPRHGREPGIYMHIPAPRRMERQQQQGGGGKASPQQQQRTASVTNATTRRAPSSSAHPVRSALTPTATRRREWVMQTGLADPSNNEDDDKQQQGSAADDDMRYARATADDEVPTTTTTSSSHRGTQQPSTATSRIRPPPPQRLRSGRADETLLGSSLGSVHLVEHSLHPTNDLAPITHTDTFDVRHDIRMRRHQARANYGRFDGPQFIFVGHDLETVRSRKERAAAAAAASASERDENSGVRSPDDLPEQQPNPYSSSSSGDKAYMQASFGNVVNSNVESPEEEAPQHRYHCDDHYPSTEAKDREEKKESPFILNGAPHDDEEGQVEGDNSVPAENKEEEREEECVFGGGTIGDGGFALPTHEEVEGADVFPMHAEEEERREDDDDYNHLYASKESLAGQGDSVEYTAGQPAQEEEGDPSNDGDSLLRDNNKNNPRPHEQCAEEESVEEVIVEEEKNAERSLFGEEREVDSDDGGEDEPAPLAPLQPQAVAVEDGDEDYHALPLMAVPSPTASLSPPPPPLVVRVDAGTQNDADMAWHADAQCEALLLSPPTVHRSTSVEPQQAVAVHDRSLQVEEAPTVVATQGTLTDHRVFEEERALAQQVAEAAAIEAAIVEALRRQEEHHAALRASRLRVAYAQTDDVKTAQRGDQTDTVHARAAGSQCDPPPPPTPPPPPPTVVAVAVPTSASSSDNADKEGPSPAIPIAVNPAEEIERDSAPRDQHSADRASSTTPPPTTTATTINDAAAPLPQTQTTTTSVNTIVRKTTEHRFVADFEDDDSDDGHDHHGDDYDGEGDHDISVAEVRQYTVTSEVTEAVAMTSGAPIMSEDWHRLGTGLMSTAACVGGGSGDGELLALDPEGNASIIRVFGPEFVHSLKQLVTATRGIKLSAAEVAEHLPTRCEGATRHPGFANLYRSLLVMYHLNA